MINKEEIILGGGCFWCLEACYQKINHIIKKEALEVISGYSGGDFLLTEEKAYKKVCSGKTGHAEVIKIAYDTKLINYEQILDVFFHIHDPTTYHRQGNDIGSHYRSIIFYYNEIEKDLYTKVIEKYKKNPLPYWENKEIITELKPFKVFYPAENYHQNYYQNYSNENPYCFYIIKPKLEKIVELKDSIF